MSFFLGFFLLVFPYLSEASSSEGIPVREIFFQTLNFSLFFGLFLFLLKKPVRIFYKTKRKDFLLFEEQAKKQNQEMKASLQKWEQKVKELDLKEETIKQDAEREGKKLQAEKKIELKDLKKRLQAEKEFFIHLESEKIKQESIERWQEEVVRGAKNLLAKESLNSKVQQKLYQEFFEQLEGRQ